MDPLNSARVLLGVSGGIAAYKAAALTSTLVQSGATVDVIMTAAAERFITPLTFSSLTARPVYTSLWDAPERIPHIRLVREAQVFIVAPASANVIAKIATGIADDLLTTALLASRIPIVVAPAMNSAMYERSETKRNIDALRERGIEIVEPESGFLAEREIGQGRLASEERLLDAIRRSLARTRQLQGKRVLVTAGPTVEALDPVRHFSNPSTGAMGIALAREAAQRGADVTLILGPTLLAPPPNVRTVAVKEAREMYEATMREVPADLVIAAAAVSDWRPAERFDQKLPKGSKDLNVRMVRNPDVLQALGDRKDGAFLVGFAAETESHQAHASEKLRKKNLDAIALNDVSGERGFGLQESSLTLLWRDGGELNLGSGAKEMLAARLLDAIGPRLNEDADAARD
ncbi:MAG: bifunctional phosphopantothenoylcysteine decarboxylase/phosphopantothenate--cysteine ligase CoaBC [Candidatus Eremiobacteraeota bacterium]|nr:bifunctional phosphopantothenoylcysteine decarboxylase/phosphopantothenate--cysteine ligase CoaBC [Candidatus Eremiobacteraeota bacterium]MBV9737699.1 bifunctional phosphopantothenoylcysteine decarboxylase/phosphopantothenate--cysteine ligase CoaBC [Candidatus Eremiobacteraeota bacterium]